MAYLTTYIVKSLLFAAHFNWTEICPSELPTPNIILVRGRNSTRKTGIRNLHSKVLTNCVGNLKYLLYYHKEAMLEEEEESPYIQKLNEERL